MSVAALVAAGLIAGAAAPAQAATVVGVCTITIGEPHPSHHVQGNINSYGRIGCSIGMPNVHVRATLEKANGQTWRGKAADYNNTSPGATYSSYSPIPCANNHGTYRTQVAIAFRSPAGYNPSYHAKTYYSIWRSVACGVARIAPDGSGATGDAPEVVATIAYLDDGTIREATPAELETAEFVE